MCSLSEKNCYSVFLELWKALILRGCILGFPSRTHTQRVRGSSHEMARPMLFVLGVFWAELNGGVLVSATSERVPMKSREKASYLELTILD